VRSKTAAARASGHSTVEVVACRLVIAGGRYRQPVMLERVRPPSFDEQCMTEWSEWVLDHGLPELPAAVAMGESVPVARWAGPRAGAVLHLQWGWSDDHTNDELCEQVEVFDRVAGGWDVYNSNAGSNWTPDPPLQRPQLAPRHVIIGGGFVATEPHRSCVAVSGLAGIAAHTVEVIDTDGVTRRGIESPLGVFIVAFPGHTTARVRVLDAHNVVLAEHTWQPAT